MWDWVIRFVGLGLVTLLFLRYHFRGSKKNAPNIWQRMNLYVWQRAMNKAVQELEDIEYHISRLELMRTRWLRRWGVQKGNDTVTS